MNFRVAQELEILERFEATFAGSLRKLDFEVLEDVQ